MLAPGFSDPVLASQAVFRTVMEAMARPGLIATVDTEVAPPAPLGIAVASLALTLLDFETPVWLDPGLARASDIAGWFKFHTGASITADPGAAAFAFIADPADMPAFDRFCLGTVEYPDRSTTLVLQVDEFGNGQQLLLRGPGIPGARSFSAQPLPEDFPARLVANRELFPRGVDLILVSKDAVAALPRSLSVVTERG
jgi:alpha-D-ribose 1-methylphosphonate 5-triphosphate synthase subunit PhnH